jgi:hypothetical protein
VSERETNAEGEAADVSRPAEVTLGTIRLKLEIHPVGIESGERFGNPHTDPAEWFIVDTGPAVWRVVGQFAVELGLDSPDGYRKLLSEDIDPKTVATVAAYYEVPVELIQNALKYARAHSEAVIARLIADRFALPDAAPA